MNTDRIDSTKVDAINVFCDESLGVYIPKDFADSVVVPAINEAIESIQNSLTINR